jgi:hypothetical protein
VIAYVTRALILFGVLYWNLPSREVGRFRALLEHQALGVSAYLEGQRNLGLADETYNKASRGLWDGETLAFRVTARIAVDFSSARHMSLDDSRGLYATFILWDESHPFLSSMTMMLANRACILSARDEKNEREQESYFRHGRDLLIFRRRRIFSRQGPRQTPLRHPNRKTAQ